MVTHFSVLGHPATKGSTVSFMGRGGRIVTKTDSTGLAAWTQAVGWAAKNARVPLVPKPGAVVVSVRFGFQRPQSARTRPHPTVRPDVDKTLRALLDALTGIAYEDDSQVVEVRAIKAYGPQSRTDVTVSAA